MKDRRRSWDYPGWVVYFARSWVIFKAMENSLGFMAPGMV